MTDTHSTRRAPASVWADYDYEIGDGKTGLHEREKDAAGNYADGTPPIEYIHETIVHAREERAREKAFMDAGAIVEGLASAAYGVGNTDQEQMALSIARKIEALSDALPQNTTPAESSAPTPPDTQAAPDVVTAAKAKAVWSAVNRDPSLERRIYDAMEAARAEGVATNLILFQIGLRALAGEDEG